MLVENETLLLAGLVQVGFVEVIPVFIQMLCELIFTHFSVSKGGQFKERLIERAYKAKPK